MLLTYVYNLQIVPQTILLMIILINVYRHVLYHKKHSVSQLLIDACHVIFKFNIACPQGTFADNTTRKCSANCNTTAKLYRDPSTK